MNLIKDVMWSLN